jgi:hypothetical protein
MVRNALWIIMFKPVEGAELLPMCVSPTTLWLRRTIAPTHRAGDVGA